MLRERKSAHAAKRTRSYDPHGHADDRDYDHHGGHLAVMMTITMLIVMHITMVIVRMAMTMVIQYDPDGGRDGDGACHDGVDVQSN